MILKKPSYKIVEQTSGKLEDVYRQIEFCGRICYKSEDKITEDSAKPFVDRMFKNQHFAMLEHGTVYLKIPYNFFHRITHVGLIKKYEDNPYTRVNFGYDVIEARDIASMRDTFSVCNFAAVTTNFRVIAENGWFDDLKYICEPTQFHEKRTTVHFICDIGIAREFCRHRVMSPANESTRYCCYVKNKFSNQLTFIIPLWTSLKEGEYEQFESLKYWYRPEEGQEETITMQRDKLPDGTSTLDPEGADNKLLISMFDTEYKYQQLIHEGWQPQQARAVLTLNLKSELVMTGFISDWQHFFDLRALDKTGPAHPQAKEIALPLYEEFKTRYL